MAARDLSEVAYKKDVYAAHHLGAGFFLRNGIITYQQLRG
jgi:hypothetical protein